MTDDYQSEHRRAYTPKPIDPTIQRNPHIKCNKLNLIKPYEDTFLRLAPKPLPELDSVYKNDFRGESHPEEEQLLHIHNLCTVESSPDLAIDRSKIGYTKYMDLTATSYQLDYFPFSSDQIKGIAANDNITFYTWLKDDPFKKINVWPNKPKVVAAPKKKKDVRAGEFKILQNTVPNLGLTTEMKSNYKKINHNMDYNYKCIVEQLESN